MDSAITPILQANDNSEIKLFQKVFEYRTQPYYENLAKEILKQRYKLKTNMVIADEGPASRFQRDILRKILGENVVFIVLNMDKNYQISRIEKRHGENLDENFMKILTRRSEFHENVEKDEKNTFQIDIVDGLKTEEIIQKIFRKLRWSHYNKNTRNNYISNSGKFDMKKFGPEKFAFGRCALRRVFSNP